MVLRWWEWIALVSACIIFCCFIGMQCTANTRGEYMRYLHDPSVQIPRRTLEGNAKKVHQVIVNIDDPDVVMHDVNPLAIEDPTLGDADLSSDSEESESEDDEPTELGETFEESTFADQAEEYNDIFDTDDEYLDPDDEPIFPGANVSRIESYLSTFLYFLRHCCSNAGGEDLLQLLELHYPNNHNGVSSMFKLKQVFSDMAPHMQFHDYCSVCFHLFEDPLELHCPTCHNARYEGSVRQQRVKKKAKAYFIELDWERDINSFFQDETFWNGIHVRFSRQHQEGEWRDIYDGTEYRKFKDFLSNESNISLSWNTDGVPLFKSSLFSVWPIWLVVNELPPSSGFRYSRRYMVLAGLWFGESKPNMTSFLRPLRKKLEIFLEEGFHCKKPDSSPITVRGFVMCGCVDLVAKAPVQNFTQYNGYYGCSACKHPGKHSHHRHYYPFSQAELPLRTLVQTETDAQREESSWFGVKGVAEVSMFPTPLGQFDYVDAMLLDSMHMIAGIVKTLNSLWFSTKNHDEVWYLGDKVKEMDDELLQQQPPNNMSRKPRSIDKHRKYWKASELWHWLFYWSPLLLKTHMIDCYYYHHLLLVTSIRLLSGSCVTEADLQQAKSNLHLYIFLFGKYYGEFYISINFHSLEHLELQVRRWGPLWCISCFMFEDMNSALTAHVNGTHQIVYQMIYGAMMLRNVEQKVQNMSGRISAKVWRLLIRLGCKPQEKLTTAGKLIHRSLPQFFSLGALKPYNLTDTEGSVFFNTFQWLPSECSFFLRIRMNRTLIYSTRYGRTKVTNSCVVSYTSNGRKSFGVVQFFCYLS
eukprot:Lithocolla_globosa_v1_NODE_1464_length_2557_cov_5.754996.p1 type:complete len:810 gc:universal NODE_1464_length_2557_cov_5.754996:2476-47(-)